MGLGFLGFLVVSVGCFCVIEDLGFWGFGFWGFSCGASVFRVRLLELRHFGFLLFVGFGCFGLAVGYFVWVVSDCYFLWFPELVGFILI